MMKSEDPFKILNESNRISNNQIDISERSKEVSEVFLVGDVDSLWLGKVVTLKRMKFFFIILVLVFFILFFKLFFLQFIKGREYRALAEGNRLKLEYIMPIRGIIFDRFGVPLVENVPTFSLFLNTNELITNPKENEPIKAILRQLDFSEDFINKQLSNKNYSTILIKEGLTYKQALELLLKTKDINSLNIIIDPERKYRDKSALAHLLGYTNRITQEEKEQYLKLGYQLTERVGRVGIEEFYQQELRGIPGKKQIEVDSLGKEKKIVAEQSPANGKSIFLSIDIGLQEKIFQILNKNIYKEAGAVVALDPNNGKIRAFVSWPTYDNNEFSQGISSDKYQNLISNPLIPLFNRVISGEYPSGSTIKLIMGLAGLEEKIITKNTYYLSSGGVWYDKWFFPDWKAGGHGQTNIIKALAESVNTYFYYLALEDFEGIKGLGLDKILYYFNKFGLGQLLGIDLNGEKSGFLPSKTWKEETKGEIWYPGDTLHLAIGQGDLLVTPLQIASFTSSIANGGKIYVPQLVEKIVDSNESQTNFIFSKIFTSDLAESLNLKIIAEGMREAVKSGSAKSLYNVGTEVAGKTGTAQVGGDKLPHSWFTGYFPYNSPNLVLTVLVENGADGSGPATRIAKEIIEWYSQNRL